MLLHQVNVLKTNPDQVGDAEDDNQGEVEKQYGELQHVGYQRSGVFH